MPSERFLVRFLISPDHAFIVVDHAGTWRRKSGTAPLRLVEQMVGCLVEDLLNDLSEVAFGRLAPTAGVFAPTTEREDVTNASVGLETAVRSERKTVPQKKSLGAPAGQKTKVKFVDAARESKKFAPWKDPLWRAAAEIFRM
jgi:hypothetical protein